VIIEDAILDVVDVLVEDSPQTIVCPPFQVIEVPMKIEEIPIEESDSA
jgi:hypothetical protein